MIIIGVDFHPSMQEIAFLDQETGEYVERQLNHSDGEAEKCFFLTSPFIELTGHVALSSCCAWFLAPGATGGARLLFNRIGDVMRFRASAHESPARLNPMTSRFRLNPIAVTTISGSTNQEY